MILKSFKDIYNKDYDCHHIVSIHQNNLKVPLDKGNLFLSGTDGLEREVVQNYKITSVLTIIDMWNYQFNGIKKIIKNHKLQQHHKWINLKDESYYNIYPHFDDAIEFIKQKLESKNVLVHCYMGISRSASLVLAFLMKQFRITLKEAFDHTFGIRNIISPNPTFWKDLERYEKQLIQQGIIQIKEKKQKEKYQKKGMNKKQQQK